MRSTPDRKSANGKSSSVRRGAPRYGAGVLASLVAEAAFIVLVMALALIRGKDPWHVARTLGSLVIGPEAIHPPGFVLGDVALGLFMHVTLGTLVGLIYAAVLSRMKLSPIEGELIAGTVLWLMGSWVLPGLFPNWL